MKVHVTSRTAPERDNDGCGACGGTGYDNDYEFERSRPVKCGTCHGTGIEPSLPSQLI
jgi:DnaJ-class molecular chaperone